jgi:hypothetical protein
MTEEHIMTYRTAMLCALLLLTACDNQPPGPKLFEEQREELDKAKATEAAQQQQAEEQRKAMEQQTQ